MAHILIFEPDQAYIQHLLFLLELAEIDCTIASSAEEALNWLQLNESLQQRFDLLLLCVTADNSKAQLLQKMAAQAQQPLPVAYLQRLREQQQPSPAGDIAICHAATLVQDLRQLLASANKN